MNSVRKRVLGILVIVVFAALRVAEAQNPSDSPVPGPTSTAKQIDPIAPKNAQAKQEKDKTVGGGQTANETKAAATDQNPKTTALTRVKQGHELSVEVSDLKKRIENQPNVVATAKLFLDCKPVAGLQPRACVSQNKIIFVLDRGAMQQITSRTRIVSVGVGFNDAKEQEVLMPEKVELVLLAYDWTLGTVLVFVLVLAVSLWICAQSTNLLRDHPSQPTDGAKGRYSLAKAQMAWWLFFIVSAFLFIYVAVGDFNSMTNSALILLGVSAGTAAGSKMVDSSKQKAAQNLQATTTALNTQIAEAGGAEKPAVQAKAIQVAQAEAQLQDLQRPADEIRSEGFFTDILSDENGISVHRFQMVVWTAVLTAIFACKVYQDFAMPEFSSTLLTLMGISSGAYLTLKVPEKHSVVIPPVPPAR
jgi:hypothetical protein